MSMSRHLRKIRRTKKIKLIIFIAIILLIIKCYISIGTAVMNGDIILNSNNNLVELGEDFSVFKVLSYNISDYKSAAESLNYKITIADGNACVYSELCQIKIEIEDFSQSNTYKLKYKNEEILLNNKETLIDYNLSEGENILNVQLYINDEIEKEETLSVYYIKPYEEQFLDKLTKASISTHYRTGKYENYDSSVELLKNLGASYIRTDFFWGYIYLNGKYDFSKYDNWINSMKEDAPNVKILGILNSSASIVGSDRKINTEEELNGFVEFCSNVAKHYPEILNYQILNEPNGVYVTDEDIDWYNRLIEEVSRELKSINPNIQITQYSLSAGTNDSSTYLSSKTFYNKSLNDSIYMLSDSISYNVYSNLEEKIKTHKMQFNDFGGFIKQEITEYGVTAINGMTEDEQARQIIIQATQIDKYDIGLKNIYNLWNTGTDINNKSQNYGLLNNDYTPKKSYYAVKNYYENTNGAEYIGTINLADGIEAHVYNKDGKPKVIAWTTNLNNNITIPYENFEASDMYGNKIENTNGTLTITNSPVYLDNVSNRYFYEAISNTAVEKYNEFEEKFATELSGIDGMLGEIDKLREYMTSISKNTTETQENAVKMMSEHFSLGTTILNTFANDKLDVEYVKISSMLDMLNDIGNAYEDLLTVSATARETYYTATEELINQAETTINNNSDLNILYPTKILEFSKELHEKSEYINSLEEENDIKTGLIVSNSLHSYYLADWANDFANIYVNKYIKENPVTVSYSNTDEFTNQDITVTLNIGSDSKVTNNDGKNTYTFNKNGTFTFEYERRGQAFKEKVTVTSIDKEAPSISGVVNGKIYTDSATPVISDDNLADIEVLLNGNKISFKNGTKLTEEGIYNITAKDKAGNSTSIEMYIVEKGTDGYIVDNSYILNVRQETSVDQFAKKFNLSTEYNIKRNGNKLSNNDLIATGDILQLKNGSEYTIVVAGDINKDGRVTTYDLSTFRRYILNLRKFDEIESLAADINVDRQKLGVKDYTRMRIEILGEY